MKVKDAKLQADKERTVEEEYEDEKRRRHKYHWFQKLTPLPK